MSTMNRKNELSISVDWITVFMYLGLVFLGWLNIFAAVYDVETQQSIFDMSLNSGKQLIWIFTSFFIAFVILLMDYKFYDTFAYIIYGFLLLALVAVLFLARDVAGARAWLEFGSIKVQPSEFAKFATALALAKFLSHPGSRIDNNKTKIFMFAIIAIPALMILAQNDTGSTLVFAAFFVVFYREGLSPALPILGIIAATLLILTLVLSKLTLLIIFAAMAAIVIAIGRKNFRRIATVVGCYVVVIGFVVSVDFFINKVLQPHQRIRIYQLVNPNIDPLGAGWNITQSKIAIGSGGFLGKGFLEGTQTKFDFVPEQSTDFIFCTIGEEHGFIGALFVIGLFMAFMARLLFLAERQKSKFARIYGYGVVAIIFFHFMINIGMTIGLFPVIGIPLPFFSYGGSSLWSFTILLFTFLKLDAHRKQVLFRD